MTVQPPNTACSRRLRCHAACGAGPRRERQETRRQASRQRAAAEAPVRQFTHLEGGQDERFFSYCDTSDNGSNFFLR